MRVRRRVTTYLGTRYVRVTMSCRPRPGETRLKITPTRNSASPHGMAGEAHPRIVPSKSERSQMTRNGDVWTILLVLPAGTYEYMVIEDGERWITDPSAPRTRDDGFGGTNGLLELRS